MKFKICVLFIIISLTFISCADEPEITTGYMLGSKNSGESHTTAGQTETELEKETNILLKDTIESEELITEITEPLVFEETEIIAPETDPPETKPPVSDKPETAAPPDSDGIFNFRDMKDSYARGEKVKVTIIGRPNTAYILKVRFKSGYSTANGLGETKSDANGVASWTFTIGNRTDLEFVASFEVTGNGETIKKEFRVTER